MGHATLAGREVSVVARQGTADGSESSDEEEDSPQNETPTKACVIAVRRVAQLLEQDPAEWSEWRQQPLWYLVEGSSQLSRLHSETADFIQQRLRVVALEQRAGVAFVDSEAGINADVLRRVVAGCGGEVNVDASVDNVTALVIPPQWDSKGKIAVGAAREDWETVGYLETLEQDPAVAEILAEDKEAAAQQKQEHTGPTYYLTDDAHTGGGSSSAAPSSNRTAEEHPSLTAMPEQQLLQELEANPPALPKKKSKESIAAAAAAATLSQPGTPGGGGSAQGDLGGKTPPGEGSSRIAASFFDSLLKKTAKKSSK